MAVVSLWLRGIGQGVVALGPQNLGHTLSSQCSPRPRGTKSIGRNRDLINQRPQKKTTHLKKTQTPQHPAPDSPWGEACAEKLQAPAPSSV